MFDQEFIDNYKNIVQKIDKEIKSKKMLWRDGDMPQYGGADHWCNCQDYPDNPWDKIDIKFISLDNEDAVLTWTWGNSEWKNNFNYKIKVRKINDYWKISYLQGFDINLY